MDINILSVSSNYAAQLWVARFFCISVYNVYSQLLCVQGGQ